MATAAPERGGGRRGLSRVSRLAAALAVTLGAGTSAAAAPAPAAAEPRVEAGPLAARVGGGAFGLTLTQRRGAGLRLTGLAFRTPAGWSRATRVASSLRDGRTLRLRVATDDGAGRRLAVAVLPAGGGTIAVRVAPTGGRTADVAAVRATFAAPAGERYYGFGERADAVEHRGRDVEDYVSDGPFSAGSRAVTAATIPPWGFRARDDATYYPVPWMLSGRGYGVLVDDDATSTFHLGTAAAGSWDVEVAAPVLALRIFAGPTPAGALARFTRATGRQPPAAAAWAYGPWLQTGQPNAPPLADQIADLDRLREADAPVSAAETQLRYLPCGLDRGNEDYEAQRVAYYHRQGLAVLTYVNPMLCASYDPLHAQAAAAGALQRTAAGSLAQFDAFVGGTGPAGFTVQPVGQFDFSRPAGSEVYASVLRRLAATGHDGWMEDFGEYTPPVAVDARGRTGTALHNAYPREYHCAAARIAASLGRPVVRFQRSGWTGAARCADDVWGGDPTTTFGLRRPLLRREVRPGHGPVRHQPVGLGHRGLQHDRRRPEADPRAAAAVDRVRRGVRGDADQEVGPRDPGLHAPAGVGPGDRRHLAPLHQAAHRAVPLPGRGRRGVPPYRPAAHARPRPRRPPRPAGRRGRREFRFGPDLLAAPVLAAGARSRAVYLPRGRWLDVGRSVTYDASGDGALHLARAFTLRGGRTVRARAPIGELPLYVRAGAVLPLLPSDVSTLSPYGTGVVRLADRRGSLRLLAFPRGRSTAGMFATERVTSLATAGRWSLAVRGARTRHYALEASTTDLRGTRGGAFAPCRLAVGAHALPRRAWHFDVRRRVWTASFLRVATRCGVIRLSLRSG